MRRQVCLFTLGHGVWRKTILRILITKSLQIIGHCDLLHETVYCLLFVFIAGAVTKDAQTQTEITMNDKLFQQSVISTSQREDPDGNFF